MSDTWGVARDATYFIVLAGGLILSWYKIVAKQEATLHEEEIRRKNDIDKIGTRITNHEKRLDDEVERCREKQAEVLGRVIAMEQKKYITMSDHDPVQAACRADLIHMIENTDKKVDKFEVTVDEMKTCLHRMDKNIATLVAYNKAGGKSD